METITIKLGPVTIHVVAIEPGGPAKTDPAIYGRQFGMSEIFPAAAPISLGPRILSADELNKLGNGLVDTLIMSSQHAPIARYQWPVNKS